VAKRIAGPARAKKPDRLELWRDAELIEMATEMYDVVYNAECFGTSDVTMLETATRILEARAYTVVEAKQLEVLG